MGLLTFENVAVSPPPPPPHQIAFSFLALKCYIHFPKEATRKWTVTNTVYFWNEPPQVLKNGLGFEESLIFLWDHISPLNKGAEITMAAVNDYDFNIKLLCWRFEFFAEITHKFWLNKSIELNVVLKNIKWRTWLKANFVFLRWQP